MSINSGKLEQQNGERPSPDGVRPDPDKRGFTADDRDADARASRYARRKRILGLIDLAGSAAILLALLLSPASTGLRSWAVALTDQYHAAVALYGACLLVGAAMLSLPLEAYSGYVVERGFGMSRQRFRSWLWDWGKAGVLQVAFGVGAIEVVYTTLNAFPEIWWLLAAGVSLAFGVIVANLAPVLLYPLFFKFEPLPQGEVRRRLVALSSRAGTKVRGVYVWKLGEKSPKSNAALMGWGNTRRIVVADTMLASNTPDEVETVLAHEIGHHVHRDMSKLMLLQIPVLIAAFWMAHVALNAWSDAFGLKGPSDVANFPLLLLVAGGLSLIVLPLINAISRRLERGADRFALEITQAPEAFAAALTKLRSQNLAQAQPHPVIEALFYSHPSLKRRIEFARGWHQEAGERRARPGDADE